MTRAICLLVHWRHRSRDLRERERGASLAGGRFALAIAGTRSRPRRARVDAFQSHVQQAGNAFCPLSSERMHHALSPSLASAPSSSGKMLWMVRSSVSLKSEGLACLKVRLPSVSFAPWTEIFIEWRQGHDRLTFEQETGGGAPPS